MSKPQRQQKRKPQRQQRRKPQRQQRRIKHKQTAARNAECDEPSRPRLPPLGRPGQRYHRNVACKYLGISRSTAIRYEKEGLLVPIKDTNKRSARVYYSHDEVARLMKAPTT